MKIICIGLNYGEHVKEMDSVRPDDPVVFMKPETALLKKNQTFYYPDFSKNVHYEAELVLKINKPGKNIQPEFAHKYYDEIGIGIDFTARDIQAECKKKGLPWETSKGFDGAAAIGRFVNKKDLSGVGNINFSLEINDSIVQKGNSKNLLTSFDDLIVYVSKFFTLKKGDLIYTGTPEGVGPVFVGDRLKAYVEGVKLLDFTIK